MKILSRVIRFDPQTGRPVKALKKWIIPLFSIVSLIWVLIRVIPKPQRAAYPCMKVAIPFASSLIIYITGVLASLVFFKNAYRKLRESKYMLAGFLLVVGLGFGIFAALPGSKEVNAAETASFDYEDPLGPNVPIGEAKGILPGRVVWVHNPDATNENCRSKVYGDGYFLDKNCNQDQVDKMLQTAILEVSGKTTEEEAWSSIFTYFNKTHDRGEVGYTEGEKIFFKINAVHAWPGNYNKDLSIKNNGNYGNVDTSPQVILAVLRQLINKAGVPEDAIYIGDPFTQIFKHTYDKLYAEFPNIHYMSFGDYDKREKLKVTNKDTLHYSDRGTVMLRDFHTFYDCTVNADYVMNVPAMKGHRWGGVTFFAKNHFGSNTGVEEGSWKLHNGLHRVAYDLPLRDQYRQYRVMVDLMAYKDLGGKTLIYIGDLLWGTSYEHDPPAKFLSAPFNNDWSSSLLVSLDPVAIASVALDILQEEFQVEDLTTSPPRYTYVRFGAVDDYLHQAASSDWWPEGITYDPEDDGTPMGSLGVHEHWNNAVDRQYSRNLNQETGEGIELIYKFTGLDHTSVTERSADVLGFRAYLSAENSLLNLEFNSDLQGEVTVSIFNMSGQMLQVAKLESVGAHSQRQIALDGLDTGLYVVSVRSGALRLSQTIMVN